MRAGRLRHRITIEQRQESRDGTGAVVWSWTSFLVCSASIEPLSTREWFAAAQLASEVTTEIRIRYQKGITETMRVVHDDQLGSPSTFRYFEIRGVREPGLRHTELVLLCAETSGESFANG